MKNIDSILDALSIETASFNMVYNSESYQSDPSRMKKIIESHAVRVVLLDELANYVLDNRENIPEDCEAPLLRLTELFTRKGADHGLRKTGDSHFALKSAVKDCQTAIQQRESLFLSSLASSSLSYFWSSSSLDTNNVKKQIVSKLSTFNDLIDDPDLIEKGNSIANPERFKTAKSAKGL